MKTRMITATLIALFAFTGFSGSANNRVNNSDASCHENLYGIKSQEMLDAQVSFDANVLKEWIDTREIWEQESQEMVNDHMVMESTSLEEWISGMESWEQKGEDTVMTNTYSGTMVLDSWITGIESWDQK